MPICVKEETSAAVARKHENTLITMRGGEGKGFVVPILAGGGVGSEAEGEILIIEVNIQNGE